MLSLLLMGILKYLMLVLQLLMNSLNFLMSRLKLLMSRLKLWQMNCLLHHLSLNLLVVSLLHWYKNNNYSLDFEP